MKGKEGPHRERIWCPHLWKEHVRSVHDVTSTKTAGSGMSALYSLRAQPPVFEQCLFCSSSLDYRTTTNST